MIKIIFLDIDGVLNSKQYKRKIGSKFVDPQYQIDPLVVKRLNDIIATTNAKIVISSTWRLSFICAANALQKMQDCFADYGINDIVDCTPQILASDGTPLISFRGDEIKEWLKRNKDVSSFVVLDDIDMSDEFGNKMILTSEEDGLQDHHIQMAIGALA